MCTSGQEQYLYLSVNETQFPTFSTTDMYITNLDLSANPCNFYTDSISFIKIWLQREGRGDV